METCLARLAACASDELLSRDGARLRALTGLRVRVGKYMGLADDGTCVIPWDLFHESYSLWLTISDITITFIRKIKIFICAIIKFYFFHKHQIIGANTNFNSLVWNQEIVIHTLNTANVWVETLPRNSHPLFPYRGSFHDKLIYRV